MTNLSMKISLRPDIILPNMTGVRLYPHINCMFNLLSVRSYTVIPVPMVNAVVFFQLLCAPKELGQQRGCSWPHVLLLLIYLLSEMNFIFFLNAPRILTIEQTLFLENSVSHLQRMSFIFHKEERYFYLCENLYGKQKLHNDTDYCHRWPLLYKQFICVKHMVVVISDTFLSVFLPMLCNFIAFLILLFTVINPLYPEKG